MKALLKLSGIYLGLTAFAVYFSKFVRIGAVYANKLFTYMLMTLSYYFTNPWLAKTATLIILPLLIAVIPGGLYWLSKRKIMPYFLELTWFLWLVFVTTHMLT